MPAPYVPVDAIRRMADDGAYARGLAYFQEGAVEHARWMTDGVTLTARVAGSSARSYTVRVRFDARTSAIVASQCSCPLRSRCKHVVAALLAGNAQQRNAAQGRRPDGAGASWRSLVTPAETAAAPDTVPLALGVELRHRPARSAGGWQARRAEAAHPRQLERGTAGELFVGLRPLLRSDRSGAWIKGDASWDAVRRPGSRFPHAQSRWFAELYSIARDVFRLDAFGDGSEWLTLDSIPSALLWTHLRAADGLGIPLVPTQKLLDVRLARSASARVRIDEADDGALSVRAEIEIDGAPVDLASVRPVARSGVYAFASEGGRISLTLAPVALADPVALLVGAQGELDVPAEDAEEFVRDALPVIARRVEVRAPEGIEVPERPAPQAVIAVTFHPGDRTTYALSCAYAGLARHPLGEPGGPASPDPDRDGAAEAALAERIARAWEGAADVPFAPSGELRDVDAAEFSERILPALEAEGVRVETSGSRRRYRELAGVPEISVSTVESTDADWFDLGVVVTIDGRRIPFAPLFTAISQRRKKLLLADGDYFSLAHPALQRLRDLVDEAATLSEWEAGPRISRYQTALWADFEDLADESAPAASWRATAEGLRDIDRIEPTPPPAGLAARLRPYQQAGLDWLAFLWRHRLGGILADDMGLGKTIQMLALILHTREAGERRPFLVVAPTSVTATWRDEAARFAPSLRVHRIDATRTKRSGTLADAAAEADIVVTSYALLRLDAAEYAGVEWAGLILDEAQFAKNPQTGVHRAAADLRADVTFAVTGTPLENGLSELWALLSLAAPGLFPSARRFREEYIGPIEKGKVPENQEGADYRERRLARLRRRIRPLMLRRTKELVADDLPPKQEQRLHVELSAAHREVYDTVLQRERQKVLGLLDDLDRNRFIVFRSLTLLRLLSLAPELVDPAHAHIPSSKLDALVEQLSEVIAEGHRALVFSQFTSYLDIVAARLDREGIAHAHLDGSTRDRPAVVESFRSGDAPVFLISLKAGGFGLTLTEADYVYLLDPWWNPAAEAQAVDRAHRIGQTKQVMVYRMIAADTIEEKVMALQERKARLFSAVMDDDALFSQALTADDIRGLLEP
ncbi:DEAD/DEAH box helicase [Microbacterium barkeri]|uniref:DEAD/DEAH box helicase n=1 Tax=Microbacterium barkeri TaxID=33917 RepID=UPI0024AF0DB6|nr:DEAD/DEAH box helicase [Microbacterium barkeri]MDI6942065.1 DEAD/DEAH box helicase [Microbacterium barkeri]